MAYENLLVERRGRLTSIVLNRPQVLNALGSAMIVDLEDALDEFDRDDEQWIAVISGAGRAFSAGADLRRDAPPGDGPPPRQPRSSGTWLKRYRNWKPVIAAVHGYCYGFGFGLAVECDVIIAAEDARFGIPEARRGMSGGNIWAKVFPWMPSKVVNEMALTGDPLTAQDAYRHGLVNQVVPSQEDLLPAADRMAERILTGAPLAIRQTVRALRLPGEAFVREVSHVNEGRNLTQTEDAREAQRAFAERRPPVWTGR